MQRLLWRIQHQDLIMGCCEEKDGAELEYSELPGFRNQINVLSDWLTDPWRGGLWGKDE